MHTYRHDRFWDGVVNEVKVSAELHSLHAELSQLYRGNSTDQVRFRQLWNRVDKLEEYQRETLNATEDTFDDEEPSADELTHEAESGALGRANELAKKLGNNFGMNEGDK